MTAPALRHDLRCPSLRGDDPTVCTCRDEQGRSRRDATAVVPLSGSRAVACPVCAGPALWQVGPSDRACSDHLGHVLTHVYATRYDGFAPITVTPVQGTGGAA